MKSVRMAVAAGMVVLLAGCGGGGGGGDNSPAQTASVSATKAACPTGAAAPGGDTSKCDAIGGTALSATTNLDPAAVLASGLPLPFNGTVDAKSVTTGNVKFWLGAADTGTQVSGTPALSADGKTVTFTPAQRPAYGASYTLVANVKDTAGHSASWTVPYTTAAMQCNNITGISLLAQTTWSNPANYSSVLRDCVAPLGVQAVLDAAYNKMDVACIFPVIGQPLSDACKTQLANGTVVLADTTIVINSHLVTWAFANGSDGLGKLAALDTNDPSNASPIAVATAGFSSAFKWGVGNTTGVLVCAADGNAYQVSAGSATGVLNTVPVRKC